MALRDGREKEVMAQDLVPGDVVMLQATFRLVLESEFPHKIVNLLFTITN